MCTRHGEELSVQEALQLVELCRNDMHGGKAFAGEVTFEVISHRFEPAISQSPSAALGMSTISGQVCRSTWLEENRISSAGPRSRLAHANIGTANMHHMLVCPYDDHTARFRKGGRVSKRMVWTIG